MYDREPNRRVATTVEEAGGYVRPVRCKHCGRVYDLASAERVARYADRDVFKTPCCNRQADTRGADYMDL